jgi:hypothetical protein
VSFDKYPVTSRRGRGPGEDRRERSITATAVASTARALNRMGGVKNDRIPKFPDPIERTHIRNQIVIPKANASFRKDVRGAAEGFEFVRNISNIPRREELPLFHVHCPAGFGGRSNQIGLPTEERWNLQKIDELAGRLRVVWRMDVSRHRHGQFIPDFPEQSTTGFQSQAAIRFYRSAIRLVVGSLEDPPNAQSIADLLQIGGNREDEFLGLDHARAKYIHRPAAPDFQAPNIECFHNSKASLENAQPKKLKGSPASVSKSGQEP